MDKDRQIRFLYPSLIFVGSIALGIWLDSENTFWYNVRTTLDDQKTASIIVGLLGIGSLVFVLGFLIGTVTILLLRFLFFIFTRGKYGYEFKLPSKTYQAIGKKILAKNAEPITEKEWLYASVVFDHSFIDNRNHDWIVRRWNGFMIASFSVTGLIASVILGCSILGISLTFGWGLTVVGFVICFFMQARFSWLETMRMITFLTKVKKPNKNK